VQVLQLVRELRAAGIFTAVAVTRPFTFEGPRKMEAADKLTAALRECAHLVAVIEQASPISPFSCAAHVDISEPQGQVTLYLWKAPSHGKTCVRSAALSQTSRKLEGWKVMLSISIS
jgi:hypothetical protein